MICDIPAAILKRVILDTAGQGGGVLGPRRTSMPEDSQTATSCLHLVTESRVRVIGRELGDRGRLASLAVLMQCRRLLAHIWICLNPGLVCRSHAVAIAVEEGAIDGPPEGVNR